MRYLVTGGCGFIGSHLVDALVAAKHDVTVLDDLSTGHRANLDPRARLIIGDVADAGVVAKAMDGVDGCFHLAAVASVQRCLTEWQRSTAVNLAGTINTLDASRRAGASARPVVFASSAAIYGDAGSDTVSEARAPAPISFYGADKLGSEHHARIAADLLGVPATGLRFFNVYGPRQDPSSPYSGVISIFVDRLERRQGVTIFGDGEQVRDFVFVGDVVAHLVAAMRRLHGAAQPRFDAFNVCTGRATSVNMLLAGIADALGVKPAIERQRSRPGDIRVSIGDPTRARAALDVSAEIRLADGLARLIASRRQPKTA
jgi:UDP-glucose 4-epimerase